MKRLLLITLSSVLVLCVACIGLGYFVILPRAQDKITGQFHDGVATVVAQELNTGTPVAAGQYVITQDELSASLASRVSGGSGAKVNSVQTVITTTGVKIVLQSNNNTSTVDVGLAAENGQLVVTSVDSSSWIVKEILPHDKLKSAIEGGVNSALAAQHLTLSSLSLEPGKLVLTTVAAP